MHDSAILAAYEASEPGAALCRAATRLAERIPLRSAFWVDRDTREVRASWPDVIPPSPELRDAVLDTHRVELLPLTAEFPADAERFGRGDLLVLPLGSHTDPHGAAALIGERGTFEKLEPWARLGEALARIAERHHKQCAKETECDQLRQQVEESEALHTLGLAANRTLDPEEVFPLVARLTRTLLGAHYVTVHAAVEGRLRCIASVGLRDADGGPEADRFAERVVERRTVVAAGPGGAIPMADLHGHVAQGMQAGLGVPLSLFGETFGAIVAGYRRPYTPNPRDTRLAVTLAGHAAVAISNARLHHALAERSHELQDALEELQRGTRAKERFFAFMNHELRTPLNGVIGYQTLLLRAAGQLPDRAGTYLARAHRSAQDLLGLVNDILDLSKISEGKMQLVTGRWTLREIVDEALATLQPVADGRGVPIEVGPLDGLPPIETDGQRLRQILLNLLSNAVKFTAGGVRLDAIPIAPGEDETGHGGGIEIRVSDTGAGIALEHLERIFEAYEQASSADAHRGTGLGLPISRQLARMLGGDVWAESEVGVGSTFVLSVPLGKEAGVESVQAAGGA